MYIPCLSQRLRQHLSPIPNVNPIIIIIIISIRRLANKRVVDVHRLEKIVLPMMKIIHHHREWPLIKVQTKMINTIVKMNTNNERSNTIEITSMKWVQFLWKDVLETVSFSLSSMKCILFEHWKRRKVLLSNLCKRMVLVYFEQFVSILIRITRFRLNSFSWSSIRRWRNAFDCSWKLHGLYCKLFHHEYP